MKKDVDSFSKAMLDLSFTKFMTPSIARYIYLLGMVCAGISSVSIIFGGLSGGFGRALVSLIVAPVFFVATVSFIRVFLEIAVAVCTIARYSSEIARRGRNEEGQKDDARIPPPPPHFA